MAGHIKAKIHTTEKAIQTINLLVPFPAIFKKVANGTSWLFALSSPLSNVFNVWRVGPNGPHNSFYSAIYTEISFLL
jgi:hypothetical protein